MSTLLAGLTFDARTGLLQGRGHALYLPAGQARLFAVLWRAAASNPGLYLAGPALMERFGAGHGTLSDSVRRLRGKLAPFGLALDAQKGVGGGYRLVELATSPSSSVRGDVESKVRGAPASNSGGAR